MQYIGLSISDISITYVNFSNNLIQKETSDVLDNHIPVKTIHVIGRVNVCQM